MCPHIPAQQKGECASARGMCSGTSARNTHTTPDPTHLNLAGGASAGSSSCSASSMEAPKVRLAPIAGWLARTSPPTSPNCSDEPSTYLDSRHDTSVADSSRSLGCGSEQLPPPLHPPTQPSPSLPLPWRGDDDLNCMYYTTTCNPMGHGSIGLTLSLPARPPARPPRICACRVAPPAQRMMQDDESEVVWGDPDHRLMTMRHLSDELSLVAPAPHSHAAPARTPSPSRGNEEPISTDLY